MASLMTPLETPTGLDEKKSEYDTTAVKVEEVVEDNLDADDAVQVIEHEHDFTEADFTRVKRKADFILLPLLWLCYGIQQTDKTSISTQALYGMETDANLTSNQYATLTTFFYVSYMISEFPSTFMLQRLNMGKGLSIYMIFWACMVIAVASGKNYAQLAAFRFLQGIFESTISPGFLFIIGSWYTTEEHAGRALLFQSANAGFGIIGNLVMLGIATKAAENPTGLAAWRGIGYFLGGMTFLAASLCLVFLGTPHEIWWLSKRDKMIANARILKNHTGTDMTGKKSFKKEQLIEAFKDPQTWFCAANTFLSCIPNGGLTAFGSLINKSFGFDNRQVILYGIPNSVVSVCLFIMIGIVTKKRKNMRFWFMIFFTLPPFCGFIAISLLPTDSSYKWIKWGCYLMTVTFIIPTFMGWAMIPSNVAGKTKRTVVSSVNFMAYCVGNMVGSQVFRASDAPHYLKGTTVLCVCVGVECLVNIAWRTYYVIKNKKKDELIAAEGLSPEEIEMKAKEAGVTDQTDFNPYFRYSL